MAFETIDDRRRRTEIAQRKITITTAAKIGSETIPINGELLNYIMVAPTLATDATFDFTITNEDSETVYTNTGMAETASTTVLLSAAPVPLCGTMTFSCSYVTSQSVVFNIYSYYN